MCESSAVLRRLVAALGLASALASLAAAGVITGSADPIYGIWNTTAGGDSTASSAGTGSGQYPASEGPICALDSLTGTKYLNFGNGDSSVSSLTKGVGTGFYVVPVAGVSVVTGIQFATANDAQERDPLTITLEGTNALGALTLGSSWTPLYSGPTGLSGLGANRQAYGTVQAIANSTPYAAYRVLVTSQRASSNSVQYSEVSLLGALYQAVQVVTTPGDPINGIWNTTAGGNSTASSPGSGAGQYPSGEGPANAIDMTLAKYLNFGNGDGGVSSPTKGVGTGFYVTPSVGATILSAFQFQTGNDNPARDPLTITLEGSNALGADLALGASWTLLYSGTTGLDAFAGSRNTFGASQTLTGLGAYTSYRVLVTSQRGSDNSVQYDEVRLFGTLAAVPEPGTLALLGVGVLALLRRRKA